MELRVGSPSLTGPHATSTTSATAILVGKGVLLASYTIGEDSLFFTAVKQDQVVNTVLDDLAAVHQVPKEEL